MGSCFGSLGGSCFNRKMSKFQFGDGKSADRILNSLKSIDKDNYKNQEDEIWKRFGKDMNQVSSYSVKEGIYIKKTF